jgi:hypothetical protein
MEKTGMVDLWPANFCGFQHTGYCSAILALFIFAFQLKIFHLGVLRRVDLGI